MRAIHQIHVGADTFDLETGDVSGQTGRARLRRKALDDLRALAATPGAVVTKETLFSTVWSETHVTEDSLVQCITEIRKALGADRALLETIPRQRYRLVGKSTVGVTTKKRRPIRKYSADDRRVRACQTGSGDPVDRADLESLTGPTIRRRSNGFWRGSSGQDCSSDQPGAINDSAVVATTAYGTGLRIRKYPHVSDFTAALKAAGQGVFINGRQRLSVTNPTPRPRTQDNVQEIHPRRRRCNCSGHRPGRTCFRRNVHRQAGCRGNRS
ncbi:MAG: winged helix-turn-helix domain-containing protein [Hyphomicrobiaceae bacterium]